MPRFLRFKSLALLPLASALSLAVACSDDPDDDLPSSGGSAGSSGKGGAGTSGRGGAGGSTAGAAGSGGSSGSSTGTAGSSNAGSGGSSQATGGSRSEGGEGGEAGTDIGASGAGQAGNGGAAVGGTGGAGGAGAGGTSGVGGEAGMGPGGCGDPQGDGVLVLDDVSETTTWNCPVYTLTKPIFVRSSGAERSTLTIAAGVTVRGVRGDLDALKFPGALIATRTGRLEAVGTATSPIVFTSASPVGQRAPGDWGGVALLGRSPVNTPANLADAGNLPGEYYVEGLPRGELSAYGSELEPDASGAGGAGGQGGQNGDAGAGGSGDVPLHPNLAWDCGRLEYVRIEFAGFEVAPGNELNGLTLAGCGSDTQVDRVQAHLGSDDGVEVFGGTVDLKHVLATGSKDDGLDWDQGWRGRGQFIAIQMHDDSAAPATQKGDNGIEADGYADPATEWGQASSPRIFNLTLIGSVTSVRGMRLREGTELHLRNAIVVAPAGGAAQGLIDLGDTITADQLTAGRLSVQSAVFSGAWPASGQADGSGSLYTEADYFTTGAGAAGNDAIASLLTLLPNALNQLTPGWVPAAGLLASDDAVAPSERAGETGFFDAAALYRGAFAPAGEDWAAPWAAYPAN
jgi:hypothetical protein